MEEFSRVKLNKCDRRIVQKQLKLKKSLFRHENLPCSDTPTRHLVVANGGLLNGVQREQLWSLFERFGSITDIVMKPRKSYAFVSFSSLEEANVAMNSLNGHAVDETDPNSPKLYMLHVNEYNSLPCEPDLPYSLCNPLPPGLCILENFVSPEDEVELLASLDWNHADGDLLKHRRVLHYGYKFVYGTNDVDRQPLPNLIPAVCTRLMEKLLAQCLIANLPDQLTVNQYQPGQDYPEQCDSQKNIWERTSCIAAKQPSEVVSDISKLKMNSPLDGSSKPILICDETSACQLENNYVHMVYETIATHFSDTRHSPWPKVSGFLSELPEGSVVADVGCGNGKYLGNNPKLVMIGCDQSAKLCDICRDRGHESFVCNGLYLPVRDGFCDAVICIAVIHHLSTVERRQKAVRELIRILKHGGQALIYVWALEQQRDNVKSKYLKTSKRSTVDRENVQRSLCSSSSSCEVPALPVHVNGTAFEAQDVLVPWHLKSAKNSRTSSASDGGKVQVQSSAGNDSSSSAEPKVAPSTVMHRYYHTFVEGELEQLCLSIENVRILSSYYDQGNWCVILEKY